MATYIKGSIQFTPVVEQINRKFAAKSRTCSAGIKVGPVKKESSSWMGAGTRHSTRGGLGSVRKNYFVYRENAAEAKPLSADQMAARVNFIDAKSGSYHIMHDLQQYGRVTTMWLEAKDDSTKRLNGVAGVGYTFAGWVFAVQYAGLKNAHEEGTSYDKNTFPQSFDA